MPAIHSEPVSVSRLVSRITLAQGPHEAVAVRAPCTGEELAHVPAGTDVDVELAVGRSRAAQLLWAERPIAHRAAIFLRFHDLLLERQREVLDLIQLETGKARSHALEEVLDTAVVSRYYALSAGRLLRPQRRRGAVRVLTSTVELRSPIGVVGVISPWNYPLSLAVTDAIPALIAGNAVVLKPDLQTSLTALWAVDLMMEAGLPTGVLTVVTGEGPVVGPAIGERVDFIMFTGSTATGRLVAAQAARRLIGCSLELGGKNPLIVMDDADLDKAVEGAIRGCFVGAGQVCVSFERIYVQQAVFDDFLHRFTKRVRGMKIGAALDYSFEMGSLTSERQLRAVEEHISDALAKGATLVTGGRRRPDLGPLFFEPTILTGVREDMTVFADETFGPVVSLYSVTSESEAIEKANQSRYGLNASIWTGDPARGVRMARQIRAGSVNVNEAYAAAWGSVDSPMGGMKDSGLRPRHGAEGILKFTESQTVAVQRFMPLAPSRKMDAARYAKFMTLLLKWMRRLRMIG
jgi:acyl-CoA reductase-like NAD-dependent aldehyde dehydrogenase